MMTDQAFFENLARIMRRGKWEFAGEECLVFAEVYKGVLERSKPLIPKVVMEPIKKESKRGVKNGPK